MIFLTLHWPIFMNNPLIFVSFTLLYSRGVPFVNNKYCLYQLSSIPVMYRSGIGVWLRSFWNGFNPPLRNIFSCRIKWKKARNMHEFLVFLYSFITLDCSPVCLICTASKSMKQSTCRNDSQVFLYDRTIRWLQVHLFCNSLWKGAVFNVCGTNARCKWVFKWFVFSIIIHLLYFYIWFKLYVHCNDYK